MNHTLTCLLYISLAFLFFVLFVHSFLYVVFNVFISVTYWPKV